MTHQGDRDAFDANCSNHSRRHDGRKLGAVVGRPVEFVRALQGRDSNRFGRPGALLVFVSVVFRTLSAMAMSRLMPSNKLRQYVTGDGATPHPRAAFERLDNALRDLHA